MSTFLLHLAGPMQSWGTQSRFTVRDTGREPSKSGVIGLLCAALGWPREKPVDSPGENLAGLKMGVRVDREGTMKMDYHTAGGAHQVGEEYGVARASGKGGETVVSRRYYLSDADFLVGLEGNDALLLVLRDALANPRWQLSLGRKSFVPSEPVFLPTGLRTGQDLVTALTDLDEFPALPPGRRSEPMRLVLEDELGDDVRHDQPYGAAFLYRSFHSRRVRVELRPWASPTKAVEEPDVPLSTYP